MTDSRLGQSVSPPCPSGGIYHETHWYCPDCDWVHPNASPSHTDEKLEELLQRVEQRRRDPEFMARLRRMVDENRDVLDRLAGPAEEAPDA